MARAAQKLPQREHLIGNVAFEFLPVISHRTPWARFDGSGRVKSPAEGAGGWFDPFSHEKPERALNLVSLFSDSRDAPTWSESGISRVPQVSPSHGVEDTQPFRAYVNPIESRFRAFSGADFLVRSCLPNEGKQTVLGSAKA